MLESFITGAISCLILTGIFLLFKKPRKKSHLYIQNVILGIIGAFLILGGISSLSIDSEYPAIFWLGLLSEGLIGFFVVRKFISNLKQLENNEFEE